MRARLRHLGLPDELDMNDENAVLEAVERLFEDEAPEGVPECIESPSGPSCDRPDQERPKNGAPEPIVHW